jgi:hypothetical protein
VTNIPSKEEFKIYFSKLIVDTFIRLGVLGYA